MERRDFLEKSSLLGGAGVISLASDALSPAVERMRALGRITPITPPDMDSYLALIDRGMEHLATFDLDQRLSVEPTGLERERELARKSLRTLYLTGMIRDLSTECQLHPGVQARLWAAVPEINDAVLSMTEFLSGLTETEKADLQAALRDDSNPAMQFSEALTDGGADWGLTMQRRLQTRGLVAHVAWRLRHQPPDLVIGEYLEKVEKVKASSGHDAALQRKLGARLAEEIFWAGQEALPEEEEGRGTPWGLKVMGIGLLTFGAGAALVGAGADAGLIIGTLGVLAFIVGLFALMVQLIKRSRR